MPSRISTIITSRRPSRWMSMRLDPAPRQALLHFGPYLAMIPSIGVDHLRIILEIDREHGHWFSTPPSSGYAWPVTNAASSEHKYNASQATSSGVPMRPIG